MITLSTFCCGDVEVCYFRLTIDELLEDENSQLFRIIERICFKNGSKVEWIENVKNFDFSDDSSDYFIKLVNYWIK